MMMSVSHLPNAWHETTQLKRTHTECDFLRFVVVVVYSENLGSILCARYTVCEPVSTQIFRYPPDRATKQEHIFNFPSICTVAIWHSAHCTRSIRTKTANFMLLRTIPLCEILCSPDTFVRNCIDSVTTIRARINCTQREKCSLCLKTHQRRISFAHAMLVVVHSKAWRVNTKKWQQFRYSWYCLNKARRPTVSQATRRSVAFT